MTDSKPSLKTLQVLVMALDEARRNPHATRDEVLSWTDAYGRHRQTTRSDVEAILDCKVGDFLPEENE